MRAFSMKVKAPLGPAFIGAIGVVFGDIGTSPLYAFKESLAAAGFAPGDTSTVLGLLSLIFWSLAIVVSVKYLAVIMRADNHGEGGILSLVALLQQRFGTAEPWARRAVALGVLGAALFYCDALITPAISVLSAVEGLEILNPDLSRAVIPVTLGVIVVLFAIQRRGTERVGRMFGPIMILWFVALAILGAMEIVRAPQVLLAANPWYALQLLIAHPGLSLVILGAVFLVVTGAEALYADMGHFGRKPVAIAWLTLVWPALLINYFGQGALLMQSATPIANPFYALAPQALLPVLVLLSTAATVIASQATISGAFSVTREAVQLDLLPRVRVLQTSAAAHGQIYVPAANLFMLVAVVLFVIGFGSSSALSAAYGASVVGTMLITTLLGALVAGSLWNWPVWRVATLFGLMLLVDLAFVAGNATKIASGGWVPLLLASLMFAMFVTWRDGRLRLRAELEERAVPAKRLGELLAPTAKVPGTAVFLVSHSGFVPTALLRNLEHNKVHHEQIVILHVEIQRVPRTDPMCRVLIEEMIPGVYDVRARFGFMETPDVGEALRNARRQGLKVFAEDSSFFLGWHLVRARPRPGFPGLKSRAFAFLQRRSAQAAEFFHMPTRGVVVLATEIEI
ncbi:MAG TPA: KUP/HAK/KT family potassium transporter [Steroidobacteraceae bacterium]|nr:KUP/HAK/KT family potassium transporter [Steroidobacteraceae bacterium]